MEKWKTQCLQNWINVWHAHALSLYTAQDTDIFVLYRRYAYVSIPARTHIDDKRFALSLSMLASAFPPWSSSAVPFGSGITGTRLTFIAAVVVLLVELLAATWLSCVIINNATPNMVRLNRDMFIEVFCWCDPKVRNKGTICASVFRWSSPCWTNFLKLWNVLRRAVHTPTMLLVWNKTRW